MTVQLTEEDAGSGDGELLLTAICEMASELWEKQEEVELGVGTENVLGDVTSELQETIDAVESSMIAVMLDIRRMCR